ncbi:hypothetical protein OIU76_008137 [Salix suchowensis]|nr:hypothetical protein OIU76_008137 [Salix suchowensis]
MVCMKKQNQYLMMLLRGPKDYSLRPGRCSWLFFLKNHRPDLALKHMKAALSEVNEIEWQPDQKTLSAFLNYFEDEKDVDGAERLCKIWKQNNRLNSNAYILLLKTHIAAGRLAPEMRQRLEEDNIEMNPELENLLERVSPKLA